jgi:hypothetical protein
VGIWFVRETKKPPPGGGKSKRGGGHWGPLGFLGAYPGPLGALSGLAKAPMEKGRSHIPLSSKRNFSIYFIVFKLFQNFSSYLHNLSPKREEFKSQKEEFKSQKEEFISQKETFKSPKQGKILQNIAARRTFI